MKRYLLRHTSMISFVVALILVLVDLRFPGGQTILLVLMLNLIAGIYQLKQENKLADERLDMAMRALEIEARHNSELLERRKIEQ